MKRRFSGENSDGLFEKYLDSTIDKIIEIYANLPQLLTVSSDVQTYVTEAKDAAEEASGFADAASFSAVRSVIQSSGNLIGDPVFDQLEDRATDTQFTEGVITTVPAAHPLGRTKALRTQVRNLEYGYDSEGELFPYSISDRIFRCSGYVWNEANPVAVRVGFYLANPSGGNHWPTAEIAQAGGNGVEEIRGDCRYP